MKRWMIFILLAALLTTWAALAEPADASDGSTEAVELAEGAGVLSEGEGGGLEDLPAPEEISGLADAPDDVETHRVWFEEGFGLLVPEGWVSYPVAPEDAEAGIRYALGDGSNERFLYIQITETALLDTDELGEAVTREDGLTKSGDLTFDDTRFVAFIDDANNLSCCATVWDGRLVTFMFTPQTDSDFMLTATRLMESFDIL